MNLRQFFNVLPSDGWRLKEGGCMTDESNYCPLWSAWEREWEDGFEADVYFDAGLEIGLPASLCSVIVAAADNQKHRSHATENIAELRRRLLSHCGLT